MLALFRREGGRSDLRGCLSSEGACIAQALSTLIATVDALAPQHYSPPLLQLASQTQCSPRQCLLNVPGAAETAASASLLASPFSRHDQLQALCVHRSGRPTPSSNSLSLSLSCRLTKS